MISLHLRNGYEEEVAYAHVGEMYVLLSTSKSI
jgi:hypothetical protein